MAKSIFPFVRSDVAFFSRAWGMWILLTAISTRSFLYLYSTYVGSLADIIKGGGEGRDSSSLLNKN